MKYIRLITIFLLAGIVYGQKYSKIPTVQHENPLSYLGFDAEFLKENPDSSETLVVIDYILDISRDSVAVSEIYLPFADSKKLVQLPTSTDDDSLYFIDGPEISISDELIGHRARFFIVGQKNSAEVIRIEVMPEKTKFE